MWSVQEGEEPGAAAGGGLRTRGVAVTRLPRFGAELLRFLHSDLASRLVGRDRCQGTRTGHTRFDSFLSLFYLEHEDIETFGLWALTRVLALVLPR